MPILMLLITAIIDAGSESGAACDGYESAFCVLLASKWGTNRSML